jgi:DNA processing protein
LARKKKQPKKQRELFIELTEDEKTILQLINSKETISIDDIYLQSGLSSSSIASAI